MSDYEDDDDYVISNFCYYCRKKVDNIDNHRKVYHEKGERSEKEKEESDENGNEEEKDKSDDEKEIAYTSWVTKKCHLHSNVRITQVEIRNCGLCKVFPTRKVI
jgi:hypothetical protein